MTPTPFRGDTTAHWWQHFQGQSPGQDTSETQISVGDKFCLGQSPMSPTVNCDTAGGP